MILVFFVFGNLFPTLMAGRWQPQDPFGAGSTEHFLKVFRCLLEANVSYCLLGDDTKYKKLLKTEMDPIEPTCLKDFKESLG